MSYPKILSLSLCLGLSLGLSGCPASQQQDAGQTTTTTTTTTTTESASPAASPSEAAASASPSEAAMSASPGKAQTVAGHADAGAKVFVSKTCVTCHTISSLPEAKGTIGPKLDGLASRAGSRKPGMSADAYIRESIENPTAFVVPTFQPAMPSLRTTMSDQEFADLVAYLETLK